MTCESAPSMMLREGNSPTLGCSATAATISISNVHTSPHLRPLPHPSPSLPTPTSPPPTPCLHPPFLLLLPACVLSFLFSLRCCYSNGEMWEYLRPSQRGKGGVGGCWRQAEGKRERMGDRQRVKGQTAEETRGVEGRKRGKDC